MKSEAQMDAMLLEETSEPKVKEIKVNSVEEIENEETKDETFKVQVIDPQKFDIEEHEQMVKEAIKAQPRSISFVFKSRSDEEATSTSIKASTPTAKREIGEFNLKVDQPKMKKQRSRGQVAASASTKLRMQSSTLSTGSNSPRKRH